MGYLYPKIQVEKIAWGFKVIDGRPYLNDESSQRTEAKAMFWDEVNQVIIENA